MRWIRTHPGRRRLPARALVDESALEPPLHGTTSCGCCSAGPTSTPAQLGRAETVLRAVLVDHPDDAYANLVLGRTLQRLGRAADARPHLAMAELLGGYAGTGRLPADSSDSTGPADPTASPA